MICFSKAALHSFYCHIPVSCTGPGADSDSSGLGILPMDRFIMKIEWLFKKKIRLINITFFRVIALQGLQTQFAITRTSVLKENRCTSPEPWVAGWFLCWSGQDTWAIIYEPPFWGWWEKSSGENKTLQVLPEAGPVCWTRVKREEVGPQLQISD